MLSTRFLLEFASTVVLFENDHMLHLIGKGVGLKRGEEISMKNLNEYVASVLLPIMQP